MEPQVINKPQNLTSINKSSHYFGKKLIITSYVVFIISVILAFFFYLPLFGAVFFLAAIFIGLIEPELGSLSRKIIFILYSLLFFAFLVALLIFIPAMLFESFYGDTLRGTDYTFTELFIDRFFYPSLLVIQIISISIVSFIGFTFWHAVKYFSKPD
jgi:hypothetical protein